MRNHDQLVAELMRRPGVQKEVKRLEREAQKRDMTNASALSALASLVRTRMARGNFVVVDPKDL